MCQSDDQEPMIVYALVRATSVTGLYVTEQGAMRAADILNDLYPRGKRYVVYPMPVKKS